MLPLNKVFTLETLERETNKYFSFSNQVREKYGLSFDQMKIVDLLSFEEMIALKLEKLLRIFNGKMMFPIYQLLHTSLDDAFHALINAYPDQNDSKKIQKVFAFSRRRRLAFAQKLTKILNNKSGELL